VWIGLISLTTGTIGRLVWAR